MGTITPEGTACKLSNHYFFFNFILILSHIKNLNLFLLAMYCYTCNDDVKDENLAIHLANFGIKVAD